MATTSLRGRSQKRPRTLFLSSTFSLLLSVLFAISGCGTVTNPQTASVGPLPGSPAVTFTASVTYEKALRLLTDLGLQPAFTCAIGSAMITPGSGGVGMPQVLWEPVGQRESYAKNHQLLIMPASPSTDWWNRLQAASEVSKIGFLDPPQYLCDHSALVYGTASANTPLPLAAKEPLQYAHIVFRSQESYDTALFVISDEGLRLADPCYDQAKQKGKKVDWRPMGQEKEFDATHALLVATNKGITSNLWQQHLRTLPSIVSLTLLPGCGNS